MGRKIIVAHVGTHFIIYSDDFARPFPSFFQRTDDLPIEPFFLQYAVDPFGYGILPRVAIFRHADLYHILLQQLHIGIAAILHTTVRVVDELMTFRKKLSKYCSAYTFLSQALDFGDPDLEVFYSFAKLLGHRIAGTSLDDVDVRGLVLRDFRISAQKVPEGVEGGELMPMGAGGSGAAPKRDTMARIVERLNRTWGDEGDPLVKARAVNAVSDAVAADPVTNTQITNTSNTKEAVLADGRLRNIVIRALMSMMSNELGDLAEQALDDPQAIEPLADQVYDLISQGKRYDIAELASYLSKGE